MVAFASIRELRSKLDSGDLSERELLEYFIKRFEKYDKKLGSALEIFDIESIVKVADTKGSGILCGIPGIIKDVICQKNRVTSASSKILQNYIATYNATVIDRLSHEGAFLIGRSNCDEFAMGSSTETSAYQKTANPWDLTRVPGGSSGGSAAAVAAGLVPWALGSDTGSSVRQPAAFCNGVGLKTTYGLVSRCGLIAFSSSIDQIGINTRTVYDNAIVLSAIAGHDEHDSTSLPVNKKDYTKKLDGSLPQNLTIGVVDNMLEAEGMDQDISILINNAIKEFEKRGATIKHVQLPAFDYSAAVYFIISRAEAASNLLRFDGVRYGYRNKEAQSLEEMYENSRYDGFGPEVRRRILIGNYVLSAGHAADFYHNAQKVQNMMRYELLKTFKEVDLLLLPTSSIPAFKFGAFDDNRLQMDLQDYFTAGANLTGVPAISVPCGFTKEKLPIGFQLMGSHLSEELLLRIAYAYEQHTPWHTIYPNEFL